jgi:hypothetical protein
MSSARTVQAESNQVHLNSCVSSVASDTLRDVERPRRSPFSLPSAAKIQQIKDKHLYTTSSELYEKYTFISQFHTLM